MMTRGTSMRTKSQIWEEWADMGAQLVCDAGREQSYMSAQVLKGDVSRAVGLLGDMVSNSILNENELELAKEEASEQHEANHTDYQRTLLENVHYNVYREHMIGQPAHGDRDNVQSITTDHLRDFHTTNFFGDNIVVVAAGNVDHDALVEQVDQHFSSLPKETASAIKGAERPIYIPALLFIRDDEMINANVGVFYDAPSIKHEDYYGFLLLKNMFGSYRVDQHAEHLNDVKKQYNSMHVLLGELVDVTRSDAHYNAYSDCGIFGNYFFGNEVFVRQMNYCGMCLPTIYGHYLNDVEVFRGRNVLYNQLLRKEDTQEIMTEVGKQMLSAGRRIPRSEVAKRVAHLDNYQLKHMCYEWFYDAEPSITNWGPIENVSSVGSYKYYKLHTLSTVTNSHHALFV